jgi:hypothetical protein
MKGLAEVIGYSRLEDPELEWTAEANPETVTHDLVESWYNTGVNRMSLGVQSFDTKVLTWMGRLHGPDGAVQAVNAIKEVGICNLSVDLVFGLPSRLKRCWRTDLFKVLELDVPHISLYGLSIEPDTPLGRSVRDGSEFPVDEGQYRDEYLTAVELLRAAGYQHYEVSSFSHPGFASRHNSAYWDGSPYLGLGIVALIGVFLYLSFGLIEWKDINRNTNWGVIILFGAAISLGIQMKETGAAEWVADQAIYGMQMIVDDVGFLRWFISVFLTGILTNILSNAATVAVLGPVVLNMGGDPIILGLTTSIASAFSYLTIVASPTCMIIHSSGLVKSSDYLKAGWKLFIMSVFLLFLVSTIYWPMLS